MVASSIKMYSLEQLSVIIETLTQQAVSQDSSSAANKLTNLYKELYMSGDLHSQLYQKCSIAMAFITKDYPKVQMLITFGTFDECHHKFLRALYAAADQSKINTNFQFVSYPPSIDTKDENGISEGVKDHLKQYYFAHRTAKKALKTREVAREIGLSELQVEQIFQKHREALSVKQKNSKMEKKFFDFKQYEETMHGMHCFTRTTDMFPLTRIPIDQPLTIEIP